MRFREAQVLMQFLVEAVVLSLLGGLIGIIWGRLGLAAVASSLIEDRLNVTKLRRLCKQP